VYYKQGSLDTILYQISSFNTDVGCSLSPENTASLRSGHRRR